MKVIAVYNQDGWSYRLAKYEPGEYWEGADYWKLSQNPTTEEFIQAIQIKQASYQRDMTRFNGQTAGAYVIQLKNKGETWDPIENEFGMISP